MEPQSCVKSLPQNGSSTVWPVSAFSQTRQTVCIFQPYGCKVRLCYTEKGVTANHSARIDCYLSVVLCTVHTYILLNITLRQCYRVYRLWQELLLSVFSELWMWEFRISIQARWLPHVMFSASNFVAFTECVSIWAHAWLLSVLTQRTPEFQLARRVTDGWIPPHCSQYEYFTMGICFRFFHMTLTHQNFVRVFVSAIQAQLCLS